MRERVAVVVAVAALVGWALWQRYALLTSSPYPVGVDGYYYPIQLRSLLESGGLYYQTAPLVFWLLAPLAAIVGPIAATKVGAAATTALVAIPTYLLGWRIGGGSRAGGLLAAAIVTTSGSLAYMTTEFVKNAIALSIALTYVWLLARALERPSRGRIATAVVALAATALAHKAALALAIAASIAPMWLHDRRRTLQLAGAIGAVAVAAVVAFPRAFGAAPSLFADLFRADARWSIPALDHPRAALVFDYEPAIAGIVSVLALIWFAVRLRGDRRASYLIGPAAIAALAAIPWLNASDPSGLVFRLRLHAFVALALAASLVPRVLAHFDIAGRKRAALVIGMAVGIVATRAGVSDRGVVYAHPAMRAAIRAVDVPDNAVVVTPERHIMYMVTWYARAPARLRPASVPPDRRWRLLPGAYVFSDPAMLRALASARGPAGPSVPPRSLHAGDPNGLVLMPEVTWQWILQRLPPASRQHYERWPTY